MAAIVTNNDVGTEIRRMATELDSGHPAKMDTAVKRIALYCVEHSLSFPEAMAQAFGQDDRAHQLEAENAKLREEVEQRKLGGDKLAEALDSAKAKVAALESQKRQERPRWSVRKALLILLAVIAARIVLYVALREGPRGDGVERISHEFAPWIGNILLVLAGAWLLREWHEAQRAVKGYGQLIFKWVLLAFGLFVGASGFFGGPPWDPSNYDRQPVPALIVTGLTVLLVLSKFTERVAERVPAAFAGFSLQRAFSWIASWFF
jgi:hypothetical protein